MHDLQFQVCAEILIRLPETVHARQDCVPGNQFVVPFLWFSIVNDGNNSASCTGYVWPYLKGELYTLVTYFSNNIQVLPWAFKLPDLNPFEHLLDELDRRVRQHQPHPTIDDTIDGPHQAIMTNSKAVLDDWQAWQCPTANAKAQNRLPAGWQHASAALTFQIARFISDEALTGCVGSASATTPTTTNHRHTSVGTSTAGRVGFHTSIPQRMIWNFIAPICRICQGRSLGFNISKVWWSNNFK